ncbi:MAG: protein jag [Lachnospiraceae bacterium]|nr:protein jag [Lachnospiraceae bacterium]MDE6251405.1 protein jag [Lachnospiraceae bacterium]
MDYVEFTGKTVDDALTEALVKLEATTDKIDYKVIDKGSNGILGFIGGKPAKIKARKIYTLEDKVQEFLGNVFKTMNLEVKVDIDYNESEGNMSINLSGDEMGIIIGKRGQTIDSLQYIVSLVVNKESESYIRVKLDTENYRQRRRETLENLAKNIAYKVKRTRKSVSLEPMNPYERRIIHSALQNDKYVATKSDGEEPYRHVIVFLKH